MILRTFFQEADHNITPTQLIRIANASAGLKLSLTILAAAQARESPTINHFWGSKSTMVGVKVFRNPLALRPSPILAQLKFVKADTEQKINLLLRALMCRRKAFIDFLFAFSRVFVSSLTCPTVCQMCSERRKYRFTSKRLVILSPAK